MLAENAVYSKGRLHLKNQNVSYKWLSVWLRSPMPSTLLDLLLIWKPLWEV